MKRLFACFISTAILVTALSACGAGNKTPTEIQLSDDGVTVDGETASTDETAAVYTAHDIVYYESGKDFTYGEGGAEDEHDADEAAAHTVIHITQPGTYSLSGMLSAGQIAVDLGEDAAEDPNAVVTLILDGVDITCTVAPAVIFYSVYECGTTDEETAGKDVDTSAAGANVIIADGTTNHVAGSYVARIYASVTLSEDGTEVVDSKKLHKYDGAFYAKMSMNVDGGAAGTGVLNIDAENEGLDSELHLTINGGNLSIQSGNDGINTNEDGISVTTINGGTLNIDVDGTTGEGDGIDSNGWLVVNGGTIAVSACGDSMDAGLDSDMGIYINGGTVMASGNMYDQVDGGSQGYTVFSFAQRQKGDTTYVLKDGDGNPAASWTPANDFTYLVVSSPELAAGTYTLWQDESQLAGTSSANMGGPGGFRGERSDGMEPPEGFDPSALPEDGSDGRHPPAVPTENGQPPEDRPEAENGVQAEQPPEPPAGTFEKTSPSDGGRPAESAEGADGAPQSADFVLTDGSNFFTGITTVEGSDTGADSEN